MTRRSHSTSRPGHQPSRTLLLLAWLLITALLASACAGSSDNPLTPSSAASSDPVGLALELENSVGSEDAALDAVILALNAGYSADQILDGVASGGLGSDGVIAGASPADPARNFVDLTGEDEGAFAPGTSHAVGEVLLLSATQNENKTLADLRENARATAAIWGGGSLGNSALQFILIMMSKEGFSANDVTEMLVLGIDETIAVTPDCIGYRIGSEVLLGSQGGDCQLDPGRYPVPTPTPTATSDNDPDIATDPTPAGDTATTGDIPQSATYSSTVSPDELAAVAQSSSRYGEFTFSAKVNLDQAEITVTYTFFSWHRGGEDGGPSGDQNCGSTITQTATGTGPVGSPTLITLEIVAGSVVSQTGALCDDDDAARWVKGPGEGGGRFQGQLNGLGLDGEYSAVFGVDTLRLHASPS